MPSKRLVLFCDGASRGNPGPGSFGYVVYDGPEIVAREGRRLGEVTNNTAEYEGLIQGLIRCRELAAEEVEVRSDSQLLVRQLNGEYKIKAPHIKELAARAKQLLSAFRSVEITHIPREENKLADKLANAALDAD